MTNYQVKKNTFWNKKQNKDFFGKIKLSKMRIKYLKK